MTKTTMIVTITGTKEEKIQINILLIPIECHASDEAYLKNVIESNKKDSSILLSIIMHKSPKIAFNKIKKSLDKLKEIIEQCESITVKFLHIEEVEKFKETLEKNSILHHFSEN